MSAKHQKAARREAFRVNALCAYGWSWDPITQHREAQPGWEPPTGPSVTLDLDDLQAAWDGVARLYRGMNIPTGPRP